MSDGWNGREGDDGRPDGDPGWPADKPGGPVDPGSPGYYDAPPDYGQQPPHGQPPGQGQPPGWGTPPGWGPPPPYGAQPGFTEPSGWGQPSGYGQPSAQGRGVAKPGVIPLRPLGVGEILDGAFTTMRRHPMATFGLSAAVAGVGAIVQVLALLPFRGQQTTITETTEFTDLRDLAPFFLSVLVLVVVIGVSRLLLTGMLTVVVGEGVLGRDVAVGEVWRRAFRRFWALLGVTFLTGLVIGGALIVGVLVGLATSGIGLISVVPLVLWVGIGLSLATPALILEGQSVTGALRRSWTLVRGSWWRVFGILLLAALISGILDGVIQSPFGFASLGSFDSQATEEVTTGSILLGALASFISGAVTGPVVALVTALLYVDRRIRAEGFDLTLAMAAGGQSGPAPGGTPPGQYGGTPPGQYGGTPPGQYGGPPARY